MSGGTDAACEPQRQSASPLAAVVDTSRRIWTHPGNRGIRLRRLAGWVGWQAWQRVVRRPRTIPFHGGLRMICHPHDTVTSLALYCGLYDAEEMRFLLAWLRPGDTFVDVGANVAPYSLLSTLVPDVRAVAFEPGSLALGRARANIELNGVGDRVELVPLAVAETGERARLSADRWATNALVDDGYEGTIEEVQTVSLDGFEAGGRLGRVGLLKVDVEGHELPVLRGAAGLLERARPALVVELNDVGALRRFAESAGYSAVRFVPETGALVPRQWPAEPGGNIVLVPDIDQARTRLAEPTDRH
jgi:FkbM family methyltransferase